MKTQHPTDINNTEHLRYSNLSEPEMPALICAVVFLICDQVIVDAD